MVEEEIRGGMCQAIHRYAKGNNKYMKNYDKNSESSYLMYLDANKIKENLLKFNESFIKNYDENSNKGYFLEVDVECPKKLFNLHRDLSFLPERKKLEDPISLFVTYKTKKKLCCSHKSFKTSIK